MGAGGSLPNNFKSQEPPPLPPPFYNRNSHYGVSRLSGSSCDDRRTSGHDGTIASANIGYQDPRSSESLKNEEWWHRTPSPPSLSSLRPQQETLLTYAAQMTGWQSGVGSAMPTMHQEAMELARTVSHLAAANQQLASAHTNLLAQLESLYHELNRERQLRIQSTIDDSSKIHFANSQNHDRHDDTKITQRLDNRESTIVEKIYENSELVSRDGKIDERSSERFFGTKRKIDVDQRKIVIDERRTRHDDEDDDREKIVGDVKTDLNVEYRRATDRINVLENELENSWKRSLIARPSQSRGIQVQDRYESANRAIVDRGGKLDSTSRDHDEDLEKMRRMGREIERIGNDRLELRKINEKLVNDLEHKNNSMELLRRDYEISRSQCEKFQLALTDRENQLTKLTREFDIAKLETTRLSRELELLSKEKNSTMSRIADLEKNLAESSNVREEIVNEEMRESTRLRKKLSHEMTSKGEQSRALEEALKEIKRLNEVIETGRKDDQASGLAQEILEEPTHEEEISDAEVAAVPRTSNMEEFRKELSLKREARQRAIAAVSSEMERLRRELDAEKEAHSETSRVLDLLKSAQSTNAIAKTDDSATVAANGTIDESTIVRDDWREKMKPDLEQNTNEADAQSLTDILKVSDELRSCIRLQTEKIDDLRYHLECEPEGNRNRIENLKIIGQTSREALGNRERQINKLKNLLAHIIAHLGDPRFRVETMEDVRSEHDRQIEDIRRLKSLYDERLRVLVDLRDTTFKELNDVRDKLKSSRKENVGIEEDLRRAEEKIDNQDTEISNLESQLGLTKADCRDLQNQMSVINGLFTQMLLSASSADMDLDRLTRLLQENHDLISDMAREEGTEAAALPKLLLDLVEQVEGRGGQKSVDGEIEKKDDDPKEDNIAHNLPKVWRVLLELLSCHAVESPAVVPASLSTDPNSCYKSVDTPSGPRLVISVSKTYIRLKELILEKKHLEKEMNRMKQLNTHLESKLGEQEKRLSTVSSELSKTWNVVGRMQAQHQQLHTHEKILRYELQQKRKMLQELKQELEYCREKWESARQKNTNTEIEWRSLRREFAARKSLAAQDSFNNSGESGFSDERGDDSDEEDEAVEESRIRIGPRRRARKESPRAPTPDTESEQPTDTEVSETKTGSTSTPERLTPTPETALPIDEFTSASTSANNEDKLSNVEHEHRREKPINPLDQALANVIKNLITIDETNACQPIVKITEITTEPTVKFETSSPTTSTISPDSETMKIAIESTENRAIDEPSKIDETMENNDDDDDKSNDVETEETNILETKIVDEEVSTISVFSIGPFAPNFPSNGSSKTVQFSDPLIVGPSIQPSSSTTSGDEIEEISTTKRSTDENATIGEDRSTIGQDRSTIGKDRSTIDVKDEEMKEKQEEEIKPIVADFSVARENVSENRENPEKFLKSREAEESPSTSSGNATATRSARTHEEVLAARSARLKRLEEQADWLMKKMNATSRRGSALSERLEELHEVYGDPPVPPPMPDVLPNLRIPADTELPQEKDETARQDANEDSSPDAP